MNLTDLLLIAVGLSMDAFAVSVCKGLGMQKLNFKHSLIIALFFGVFQALMPTIGWALGRQFEKYINSIDHWVAFVLLAFIGGKMIYEALSKKSDFNVKDFTLDIKELTILAIATSIDALAVGITFALLKDVRIIPSVGLIGAVTFELSFLGVVIGNKFGSRFKSKAELTGGIILVGIGLKILFEGLSII